MLLSWARWIQSTPSHVCVKPAFHGDFVSLSPNPELRKTLTKFVFRKVLENFRLFAPQFSRTDYALWSQKCGRNLLCSGAVVRTEKTTISGKPLLNRDLNALSSDCKPGVLLLLLLFNCNWVDTRWQQYSTHLHTNSTQNTEDGAHITIKKK
jgi:hypothetical protein